MAANSVTRNDVAQRAGVSSATVSHVVNGTKSVSPALQKRVQDAIKDLHYVPNRIARTMKTQRSMQVGIILSNLENPIYADLLQGFEAAAEAHDYTVNMFTAYENTNRFFSRIITTGLDGVLIEPLPRQVGLERVSQLLTRGIKVALLSHTEDYGTEVSHIRNDYDAGMALGITHLYELGHRRIAYASSFLPSIGAREMRTVAFQRHCAKRNVAAEIIDLPQGTAHNLAAGRLLGEELLRQRHEFTAVVCTNDLIAMGIIAHLHGSSISIPQDLSVLGIDNNIYTEYTSPKITSVGVDYRSAGSQAFSSLIADIKGDAPQDVRMPMNLIVRESTAPPRATSSRT